MSPVEQILALKADATNALLGGKEGVYGNMALTGQIEAHDKVLKILKTEE